MESESMRLSKTQTVIFYDTKQDKWWEIFRKKAIDCTETFASVIKPMSYKAIFAIAAAKN